MRIVFFGNPFFCYPSIKNIYNSHHQLLSVVTSPDRKSGRGQKIMPMPTKELANSLNIPVIEVDDLNSDGIREQLVNLNADIFVVIAFRILPKEIIRISKSPPINMHPSLLPKYRGSSPIQYALLNGDNTTGISIIHLSDKVDSGKILNQIETRISDDESYGDLEERLSILGADLLIKTLDKIEESKSKSSMQHDKLVTYAPKMNKRKSKIDWNLNIQDIHNHIRAFDPKPGAFSFFKGKRVKLFGSKIINQRNKYSNGEIFLFDDKVNIAIDGISLSIDSIQIEGKSKVESKFFYLNSNIKGNCFV